MKLFENGVGRPSNEIKRKRRYFVMVVVTFVLLLVVGIGYILYKPSEVSKLEGASAKITKTYTGKKLFSYRKKISCETNPKKKSNACKYNVTSDKYWNSNNIKNSLNVSASFKGTTAVSEFKIPNNLSDFDKLKIYYYVGTDKNNMDVKVGFSINNSPIKTKEFQNLKLLNGKTNFTKRKIITLDLNELRKYTSDKVNSDLLKLRVYHDNKTESYSGLLKIEKIKLVKNEVYLPELEEKKLQTIGDTVAVSGEDIVLKSNNEKVLKVVSIEKNKYGIIAVGPGEAKIEVYNKEKLYEEKTYKITGKVPTISIGKINEVYNTNNGFVYGADRFKVTNAPKNSKLIVYSSEPSITRVEKKSTGKYVIWARKEGITKIYAQLVPNQIGDLKSTEITTKILADKFMECFYASNDKQLNVSIKDDVVDRQVKQYTNNQFYNKDIAVNYVNDDGKKDTLVIKDGKAKYNNTDIYVEKECNTKQVITTLPELLELPKKYGDAINAIIYTDGINNPGSTETTNGIIKMKCNVETNYKGALSHEMGHAVDGYYNLLSGKLLRDTNSLYEQLGDLYNTYSKSDRDKRKWPKTHPGSGNYKDSKGNSNGEYFAALFATYSQYELYKTNKIDNTPYLGYKTNYTTEGKIKGKKVVLKNLIHETMKLYEQSATNNYYVQLKKK